VEKSFDKETDSTADRPFRWGKTKRKWAKVRSPRQALLRLGKDMRPLIDRTIARHSEVGDPAVFDPDVFPHARELEANWETIRDEADRVLAGSKRLPGVETISPDHGRISDGDGWRSFFLYGYGYPVESAVRQCPRTAALVSRIPNLLSAFFSIMEPGQRLKPHHGPTKAIITWHLPLRVPARSADCRIKIAGRWHEWHEGRSLIFDDTYRHEVRNDTDETRVILLIHLRRPVRFPGSLVSGGFLNAIRASPFVQDARRNQQAWEDEPERQTGNDGEGEWPTPMASSDAPGFGRGPGGSTRGFDLQ
jgi:beta-hydroxylase